jgi:hypothetical protein
MEKPPATKKPSKKPRAPNRRPTQNFADIARILAVSDAPPWLPGFLEWWSQGVRHDILVDEYRPSKLKTVKRLLGVEQAVALLQRELENPSIRNMLEAARKPGRIRVAIADLKDLSARAEIARSSTELVGKSGSTKRGPGKPDVPDVFNAKAICAARIFEAWRLLNGREPGISNLRAAEAAQAYWLAAGGASNGAGDPRNGWYDYFKVVRDNEMSPGLKRLIWRRDLEQCKRRGRAPWYLGTQFPVSEGEFRSPIHQLLQKSLSGNKKAERALREFEAFASRNMTKQFEIVFVDNEYTTAFAAAQPEDKRV